MINTFSTGYSHCGTHSLAITYESTAGDDDFVYADVGADSDYYWRCYMKTVDFPDSNACDPIIFSSDPSLDYHDTIKIRYKDDSTGGTTAKVFLVSASTESTNYFTVTEGDELRIEIHVVSSTGTCVLKVWRKNGENWDIVYNDTGSPNDTVHRHLKTMWQDTQDFLMLPLLVQDHTLCISMMSKFHWLEQIISEPEYAIKMFCSFILVVDSLPMPC